MHDPSKIDRHTAIRSLVGGNLKTSGENQEKVFYLDGQTPPTEEEIQAKQVELQAEYDSQAYARTRAEQYPELAEQLDLLWHAIDTGTLDDRDHRNKFYSTLKTVKTNNPKG